MKKRIGLDRELKLRWLDLVASLAAQTPDKVELRARLMEALATDIPAHFVRYKTCTVLIRTWLSVPSEQIALRDRAFQLVLDASPEERMALHWGMLLLAYPFFRDCVSVAGKNAISQDNINRRQVTRRIVETWGDRTTVKRVIRRVFQTLSEWGILIQAGSEVYSAATPREIGNIVIAMWLVEAILHARGAPIPFSALAQSPEIFPFRPHLTLAQMTRTDRFDSFREGTELLIGLRLPMGG